MAKATRKRVNNVTTKKDWKKVFIDALLETPNITAAAHKAKTARQHAYRERTTDPDFKAAWDEAMAGAVDSAEGELYRRAVEGNITKRQYDGDGNLLGFEREYSDTLLIFFLKAHKPEKYRETVRNEISGPDGGPMQAVATVNVYMPDNGR